MSRAETAETGPCTSIARNTLRWVDRTVATVNAQAIMLSEFEKNAAPILEQFKKSTPVAEQTPERLADIKKRVLDQMVDDRLLIQESKKKAIRVSQLEVDDGVKKVRGRFNHCGYQ